MNKTEERKRIIKSRALENIERVRYRIMGIEDLLCGMTGENFTSEGLYGLSLIMEDIRKKIKHSENILIAIDMNKPFKGKEN